jgi:hypothetical protein
MGLPGSNQGSDIRQSINRKRKVGNSSTIHYYINLLQTASVKIQNGQQLRNNHILQVHSLLSYLEGQPPVSRLTLSVTLNCVVDWWETYKLGSIQNVKAQTTIASKGSFWSCAVYWQILLQTKALPKVAKLGITWKFYSISRCRK